MILAIDTATRWAGIALHDGKSVVAETGWHCVNTHTIELTPAIKEMFRQGGISAAELKGVAVAIGPGSYTGLRVGLALAKGLALANQVPLIGVPTLDIVAASFGPMNGRLLATAAAGRKRVCAALYHWQDNQWSSVGEPLIDSWENLLADLDGEAMTFAGEITPEAAKMIRAASKAYHLVSPAASVRRSGFLAEIGWKRLRASDVDDAHTLAPIYLRDPAGN